MKLKNLSFVFSFIIVSLISCSTDSIITDKSEREVIISDFEHRKSSLYNQELFSIFNTELSEVQREALIFLYAYMPLGDIADNQGDFFLENVDYSLRARDEMPWGKDIPEREFRHFVLPIRVNNESLDHSRKIFYEELRDRVKNLSLHDAVLEVNHWCHEKVVYTPSDPRTSSPLASIKTAYGRCGEESTLAVAALRSVCIPARQVYTPRWAHTDDNHAWVEAWVDGKWYFLGACEPEPVLNLAWFNAPVSRGMMMHTKVFGRYNGPEEIMSETGIYTEINVTDNYAPVSKCEVKVLDEKGKAVDGARVDFKVYNYAEFYTVAQKKTDNKGLVSLSAGNGDMIVWASKNGLYGFKKVSFGKEKNVEITLDKTSDSQFEMALDIVPPIERANTPYVSEEQRKENNKRLALEDSIRNTYVATFPTNEQIQNFARNEGIDNDRILKLIKASRGNYKTIYEFIHSLNSLDEKNEGMDFLERLSAKDLRDVTIDILKDNMLHPLSNGTYIEREYVRNPRVAYERLTPYKAFFQENISKKETEKYYSNPILLVNKIAKEISIDDSCNLGCTPISPIGVWKTRCADTYSRNIFFVALARSLNIPARIDEVTGKVQLISETGAKDVDFETSQEKEPKTGTLQACYNPTKSVDDPKYYNHFTLSKITEHGYPQLLEFSEGSTTWKSLLKKGIQLDEGTYMLVTGSRLANGGVLADIKTFKVNRNKRNNIKLEMRESRTDIQVIGSFNSESKFMLAEKNKECSILSATGRGYFVVGILGMGQEPTNHALNDIAKYKTEIEKWSRKLVILFKNAEQYQNFKNSDFFTMMPSNAVYGIDTESSIQNQIIHEMKLHDKDILPIFIIADTFNRVVFSSHGYTIGLGEQIIKTAHKL